MDGKIEIKSYQINNLKIKYKDWYSKWQVIAPDKRVLEEFAKLADAQEYARRTPYFTAWYNKLNPEERTD